MWLCPQRHSMFTHQSVPYYLIQEFLVLLASRVLKHFLAYKVSVSLPADICLNDYTKQPEFSHSLHFTDTIYWKLWHKSNFHDVLNTATLLLSASIILRVSLQCFTMFLYEEISWATTFFPAEWQKWDFQPSWKGHRWTLINITFVSFENLGLVDLGF